MAITARCVQCRREFKFTLKKCPSCNSTQKRYRVTVRMSPTGGRRSKTVETLKLAQKVEAKFKTMATERTVFNIQTFPTLSKVWEQYIKWAKVNKGTWWADKQRWEWHIEPALGNKRMDTIRPIDVQSLIIDKMKSQVSPRTKRPYKPATIKQSYALVKRLYNWSMKQGVCPDTIPNPCNKVEAPRFDNKVTRALSGSEMGRLLDVLDSWDSNERAVLVIRYALFTGKRKGEILGLTWDCVLDLDKGLVSYKAETTKNKRTQTLPVGSNALAVLKRCHELKVSEWVFPSLSGNYFKSFENVWKRIREKAELKNFRFHDLRHTYASYLASSGKVDIYTLKELLGHRSLDMTQRYAHLINGALRKAVCVADEVFERKTG